MASHAAGGAMRRKSCRSRFGRRPVLAQTPGETFLLITTPPRGRRSRAPRPCRPPPGPPRGARRRCEWPHA
eukprot:4954304-Lingulodinium_polyedra.AAC.1